MGTVFQSVFGIFAAVVALLSLYICIAEPFDSVASKIAGVAISLAFVGVGVWCAWPLVLLIADWITGTSHLASYMERRNAQEIERVASEARAFGSTAVAVAIANVPGALLIAHFLRKDRPGAVEPFLLLAVVLPVSGAVIAAKAQTWTGVALPFHAFLGAVGDSVSAAGIAALLVLWSSIWLGTLSMRLVAALPMGPVAAFLTPVAALPYYYGYYKGYGWGGMTLLFVASVLLGFCRQRSACCGERSRGRAAKQECGETQLARAVTGAIGQRAGLRALPSALRRYRFARHAIRRQLGRGARSREHSCAGSAAALAGRSGIPHGEVHRGSGPSVLRQ